MCAELINLECHVEMIALVLHNINILIILTDFFLTLSIQLFSYIKRQCPTFGIYPEIHCLIASVPKLDL